MGQAGQTGLASAADLERLLLAVVLAALGEPQVRVIVTGARRLVHPRRPCPRQAALRLMPQEGTGLPPGHQDRSRVWTTGTTTAFIARTSTATVSWAAISTQSSGPDGAGGRPAGTGSGKTSQALAIR